MAQRALLSFPSLLNSVGPNTMAKLSMFIWLHSEKHCTLKHMHEHKHKQTIESNESIVSFTVHTSRGG